MEKKREQTKGKSGWSCLHFSGVRKADLGNPSYQKRRKQWQENRSRSYKIAGTYIGLTHRARQRPVSLWRGARNRRPPTASASAAGPSARSRKWLSGSARSTPEAATPPASRGPRCRRQHPRNPRRSTAARSVVLGATLQLSVVKLSVK